MARLHNKPTGRLNKDYEQIGRQLESLYDAIRPDRRVVYRTAFFKGIFTGVGSVIGATLVIALLLWLLSFFSDLPLVGNFVDQVRGTIDSQR